MTRLSLRGLTKDYGALTVVDRIDLTVDILLAAELV